MGTLGGSNQMLTAKEVGGLLKLPERTVRAQCKTWGLRSHRIGRAVRFRERDVAEWIDRQKEG